MVHHDGDGDSRSFHRSNLDSDHSPHYGLDSQLQPFQCVCYSHKVGIDYNAA